MVPRCCRVLVRYSTRVTISGPKNCVHPHLQSQSSMSNGLPSEKKDVCYQLLLIIFFDRFGSGSETKVTLPMVLRCGFMKLAATGKHFKCWSSHLLPVPGKNTQSTTTLMKGIDAFPGFRSCITIAHVDLCEDRELEKFFFFFFSFFVFDALQVKYPKFKIQEYVWAMLRKFQNHLDGKVLMLRSFESMGTCSW